MESNSQPFYLYLPSLSLTKYLDRYISSLSKIDNLMHQKAMGYQLSR